ncbi:MAG: hypothetical protein GY938_18985 [Ketobacter sp.]|nr:hypothetical protein [Ketobacter sp.]
MSNQTGVIGFHPSIGGNKTNLGKWMRALNKADIPFPLKAADDYGPLFEADMVGTEHGVTNYLAYRLTEEVHSASGVRNAPDYTLPPLDAAVKHCAPIIQVIKSRTPEFNAELVFVDICNEIRTELGENEKQWGDMHPVDWAGEFCLESALFMNNAGYKIIAPSFNSGTPGDLGEGTFDALLQYSQPGMLKYIEYCAENPDMAMIGLHEYTWELWKKGQDINDWYPHLFGRFEAMIAAADIAGIPRTYRIMMTEWGFAQHTVPLWPEALPHINDYSHLLAKFPQVIGVAAWTLQAGWGNVSNKIQTWIEPLINYTINERPSLLPQPQATHELFGSTLPGETEPPMDLLQRIEDLEARILDHELRLLALEGTPPIDPPYPPLLTIEANAMGVDVSAHQKEFDWVTAISNGVTYGIVRSSNGLGSDTTDENGRDKWLYSNAVDLTAMSIPWAIYHYLQPHSISDQVELVHGILAELRGKGTYPRTAVLADGTRLPALYIDVEEGALHPSQIKEFYDGMIATGLHVGIYTNFYLWNAIMKDEPVWWDNVSCWVAAHGRNTGQPSPWVPWVPYGFNSNVLWQYTSLGGHVIDNPGGSLDLNMATPFYQEIEPPIPGDKYETSFMRAEPHAWRVIKRGDGSGEDVWDLGLSDNQDVRVKNRTEGEWYEYRNDGVWRIRDTSPAPDSHGNERLYEQSFDWNPGGQIAPMVAEVGITYTYYSDVQFKSKNGCHNLEENSGQNVMSTFLLKEVIQNHTFTTGLTVDWLYVTVQTGEVQLYAMKDDTRLGWVGGGADQDNNAWSAELNELYYDRDIPQGEPDRYC